MMCSQNRKDNLKPFTNEFLSEFPDWRKEAQPKTDSLRLEVRTNVTLWNIWTFLMDHYKQFRLRYISMEIVPRL